MDEGRDEQTGTGDIKGKEIMYSEEAVSEFRF